MSERSVEHATIVIERRYPASPERTFAARADFEAKARRLGVSEGELELDFRVGGRERHQGTLPNGPVYTYQAVYHRPASADPLHLRDALGRHPDLDLPGHG
jgi:uncharacterized protein YndB with AHSA1/START domain